MLVLGSGPSKEDLKSGEPLSGLVRREVDPIFQEAGIDRERLFIINAYACVPQGLTRLAEERKATVACRPLMKQVLSKLPPETPTLIAGKWAQLSVLGREKALFNKRGFTDREWTLPDAVTESIKEEKPPDKSEQEEAEEYEQDTGSFDGGRG